MGGADAFLRFLREEALPFISERYPTAAEGRTIFGSSLGGLFVSYALLEAPDVFDNFIAVSPALWWDDERIFDVEATGAAGREDLSASVIVAVGAQEESPDIPMLARFKMITNARRLVDQLSRRDHPSLDVQIDVLEGESHTSVVPVALTRSLRTLLAPRVP